MLCERVECRVAILELAESPFIHDVGVPGVVEQAGRDPWLFVTRWSQRLRDILGAIRSTHLQHEPSAEVDTTNYFSTAYMSVGSRGRGTETRTFL